MDKINSTLSLLQRGTSNKAKTLIKVVTLGNYRRYKGTRISRKNDLISIPVNRNYRLLYDVIGDGLRLKGLFTHTEYDRIIMN